MIYTPHNGTHDTPERQALYEAFIAGEQIQSMLRAEKVPEGLQVDIQWENDDFPTWYWADYEYRVKPN